MKTVLITRPKDQSKTLIKALQKYGLDYVLFPTIEIKPVVGWSLPVINDYKGIFFTSVNSVRFFFEPLISKYPNIANDLNSIKVYAVGKKTAEALHNYQVKTESLPSKAYATDLMAMISPDEIKDQKFLFIRGSLSLGIIPAEVKKFGGFCDEITVYANQAPVVEEHEKNRIKSLIKSGKIDCVVFTSPSTASNFFSLLHLQQLPQYIKIASIGETTSAALNDFKIKTDIMPSYSTAEGIAEAISGSFS